MVLDLSAPSPKQRRRSPKQHIRIWFEFYKLALSDPRFSKQVEKSQAFYRPWGELGGLSFDKWWSTHSFLFDELKVREIQAVARSEAVIHLALPLSLGTKQAMEQVKEIFTGRQREMAAKLGDRRTKSTSVGAAMFHLTVGAELRGPTVDTVLMVYRDVYLPAGRPRINEQFAYKVVNYFKSSRTKLAVHFLRDVNPDDPGFPNQLRQLRRYIERAEDLVLAAAKGDFPGRTMTKGPTFT